MRRVTLDRNSDCRRPVVTVGTFDGVHVGHRAVLDEVRRLAQDGDGHSVVVTFDPHPRQVIDPDHAPPLLTTLDERAWRIGAAGIDVLAVVPFDDRVRSLSPLEFVTRYIVERLGASSVVVGHDHGFGRDRSGDSGTLRDLGSSHGFSVHSVAASHVDDLPVSSTRVRSLIASGDLVGAGALLGGGYPVVGDVVEGDRRGREIGFPTANIDVDVDRKLMPPPGVYTGWAETAEGLSAAVVNYGSRPTVGGQTLRLEAHLLDFEDDLYGTQLKLDLVHRLRDEAKFESLPQLKHQIATDVTKARSLLASRELTITRR